MNWTRPVLNSYRIGQVNEMIQIFARSICMLGLGR